MLIASALTISAQRADAAPVLLSQGKPTTASSVELDETPPAAATDGDPGTRWSSEFADPQWLQVDLGDTATISQVTLRWEAAYASAFQIQVSATPSGPWQTIYQTAAGTGGTQDLAVSGTGRHVRVHGTARGTGWGYSLWEFEVYGTISASCTGNAALGRDATASSVETADTPAAAAVDGNATTRWSSTFADPQWIQIDLGDVATICQVVLRWETAAARAFDIQTATNPNGPWTTRYATTTRRWSADARRVRDRTLRAHARHRPHHTVRLLAVGVRRAYVGVRPAARRLLGRHQLDTARPERPHGQDPEPNQRTLPRQPGVLELRRPDPVHRGTALH
uniref:discoidin domain-containing protein n=1 Tax=Salinispora arenicola TaxID=168697 RepID=UPI0036F3747E